MSKIDWIKLKNEYINTDISYRELAKKYNTSFSTLEKTARKEGWRKLRKEQRESVEKKVRQKTVKKIVTNEVNRLTKLLTLTDTAQSKIEKAFEQLTIYVDMFGNVTETDVIDVAKLRKLLASLKDLKDILAIDNTTSTDEANKQKQLLTAIEKAVRDAD